MCKPNRYTTLQIYCIASIQYMACIPGIKNVVIIFRFPLRKSRYLQKCCSLKLQNLNKYHSFSILKSNKIMIEQMNACPRMFLSSTVLLKV